MKYGRHQGSGHNRGIQGLDRAGVVPLGRVASIGTAARGSTRGSTPSRRFAEVIVTKRSDVASPKLFLDSVAGKLDSKVEIKLTTTTKGKVETFLTYKLENTGISYYS